jgi:hypothetical protein
LAKDGDTIVAAILGLRSPGGACELHVCLGQVEDPGKLTGELLNKALMKVHGAGARRCQISHHGNETQPTDWPGPKWTGEKDPNAKAQASQSDDADTLSPPSPQAVAEATGVEAETESPAEATAASIPVDKPESTPTKPDAEAA